MCEICVKMQQLIFMKIHSKMLPVKCRPFCSGSNVLLRLRYCRIYTLTGIYSIISLRFSGRRVWTRLWRKLYHAIVYQRRRRPSSPRISNQVLAREAYHHDNEAFVRQGRKEGTLGDSQWDSSCYSSTTSAYLHQHHTDTESNDCTPSCRNWGPKGCHPGKKDIFDLDDTYLHSCLYWSRLPDTFLEIAVYSN